MRYYIEHLPMTIPMGVQSENNAEAVEFDVSDWLARDGSLSFSVWVTRPGETEAYQAENTTLKDGILYWSPTSADTAIAGEGRVEILAVSANRRMLSGWTATSIRETTTETTTDAPVNQRPWLDQALLATEEAKAAAASAAASADQAEGVVKKEIATLTEDIARNTAPPIIPTAMGRIVTITDGAARPAVEVISHIEPLQRWNSAKVQRTGKNILPGGGDEQTGSFLLYPTDKAFEGLEGQQINISFDLYSPDGSAVSIYAYQQSGLSISNGYDFMPGANVYARYSFSTTVFRYGQTINSGNIIFFSPSGAAIKVKNIQVEFGTTATSYEPYQGQTLTTTLPETVYGGKVDWKTGVLTSTLDAEGNELDEPKVFQLTPQQLDTLKGINNVWSNCGSTELSYIADTKSYIDQRIAALLNA